MQRGVGYGTRDRDRVSDRLGEIHAIALYLAGAAILGGHQILISFFLHAARYRAGVLVRFFLGFVCLRPSTVRDQAPKSLRSFTREQEQALTKTRWANIRRKPWYAPAVGQPHRCIVSFRDGDGVEHVAEVTAGSLYEAGALALHQFRRSEWSREVCESAFYNLKVAELEGWLQRKGGKPSEVALRQKIRSKLGG